MERRQFTTSNIIVNVVAVEFRKTFRSIVIGGEYSLLWFKLMLSKSILMIRVMSNCLFFCEKKTERTQRNGITCHSLHIN